MITAIDLFCGAGGCSEGLIQAGFNILFSSDISPMVEKTYTNRHAQLGYIQGYNTWFERCDIKDLTGKFIFNKIKSLKFLKNKNAPDIDLVIGGPSCQGFSRAGRRDKKDPRNMLFKEYVRVINEINPKYIILENVEGFMDMQFINFIGLTGKRYPNGSVTPDILTNELKLIGYNVLKPKILNAADYGVPQRRNRVIFIGYRKDCIKPKYPNPSVKPKNYLTVKDAISDLIIRQSIKNKINFRRTKYQSESHYGRTPNTKGAAIVGPKKPLNNELSNFSKIVIERFSLFKQGESGAQLRKRIKENGINLSNKKNLIKLVSKSLSLTPKETINLFKKGKVPNACIDILLTKKNIRQRLDENFPSSTVLTIADDHISPWENRTFSVREMARLQSFDDSFEFLGKRTTGGLKRRTEVPQFTQVGNAVPPLLAKALALEIKMCLKTK